MKKPSKAQPVEIEQASAADVRAAFARAVQFSGFPFGYRVTVGGRIATVSGHSLKQADDTQAAIYTVIFDDDGSEARPAAADVIALPLEQQDPAKYSMKLLAKVGMIPTGFGGIGF